MVDTDKVSGSDVCVFEMTERVGGRLMSIRGLGPESDLTVDAGGYRTVRNCKLNISIVRLIYLLIIESLDFVAT